MAHKELRLRSMTGYGRGNAECDGFRITVELRSVNGRFLEIRSRLPRSLHFLEPAARSTLEKRLVRGMVDLSVTIQPLEASHSLAVDNGVAEAYVRAAEKFAARFDLPTGLTALALLKLPNVSASEGHVGLDESKELAVAVSSALDHALAALLEMRESEGDRLGKVLQRELSELKAHKEWIRKHRLELNERYLQRFQGRMAEWLGKNSGAIEETRLYQEVAFYLDRSDVTEEIDRLASHLKQCEDVLVEPGAKSIGKRLEFLAQELGREVNTIGSKSDQTLITNHVLEMKLSLEKIREQVQNLE